MEAETFLLSPGLHIPRSWTKTIEWNGKKKVKFPLSTPWGRIEGAEG
jgi:hypothetical protein